MSSASFGRTVEDRLREEYFDLLPDIRRSVAELEAEVRYCLMPVSLALARHERLVVASRVKECESALEALRRRQEGAVFDPGRPELYSLANLNDLAGVRVVAFPRNRCLEADLALRGWLPPSWVPDPVPGFAEADEPLALKYHGFCRVSGKIRAEVQIVPMLTALFWEIEHSALYKPSPILKGVTSNPQMQQRTQEVLQALKAFEEEFANLIGPGSQ